jgi:hypothetical protein
MSSVWTHHNEKSAHQVIMDERSHVSAFAALDAVLRISAAGVLAPHAETLFTVTSRLLRATASSTGWCETARR